MGSSRDLLVVGSNKEEEEGFSNGAVETLAEEIEEEEEAAAATEIEEDSSSSRRIMATVPDQVEVRKGKGTLVGTTQVNDLGINIMFRLCYLFSCFAFLMKCLYQSILFI